VSETLRLSLHNAQNNVELTRAIAQRDDEGDRLDWLMVRLITLDGVTTRARLRQLANTSDPAEFRARLDEERGERGQGVNLPRVDQGAFNPRPTGSVILRT